MSRIELKRGDLQNSVINTHMNLKVLAQKTFLCLLLTSSFQMLVQHHKMYCATTALSEYWMCVLDVWYVYCYSSTAALWGRKPCIFL